MGNMVYSDKVVFEAIKKAGGIVLINGKKAI